MLRHAQGHDGMQQALSDQGSRHGRCCDGVLKPGVHMQQSCSGNLLGVDFKHNSSPNGGACFLNAFSTLLAISNNFTGNTANASSAGLQLQSVINATVTGNIFNRCTSRVEHAVWHLATCLAAARLPKAEYSAPQAQDQSLLMGLQPLGAAAGMLACLLHARPTDQQQLQMCVHGCSLHSSLSA